MIRPQISIRTLLEIVAVIAVILAIIFTRPANNVSPGPGPGRYSVQSIPSVLQTNGSDLLLVDSQTGKCWIHNKNNGNTWFVHLKPVE